MKRAFKIPSAHFGVNSRRFVSQEHLKAPDNAPRAAANEQWLDHLKKSRRGLNITSEGQQNLKGSSVDDSQHSNRFPIKVISAPPDTHYINVESPLGGFTSIKYLRDFDKHKNRQGNFADVRIIRCRSGSGGDGAVSFFRDAGRSIGPPDGGDGGDGGGIYVQAVEGLNSLSKLRTTYIAEDGSSGGADQLDGARGKDMLITVPVGTVVRWCMNPKTTREFIRKQKADGEMESSVRSILSKATVKLQCTGRYQLDDNPRHIQLFRDAYKPGEGWLFKGKDKEYHEDKEWFIDLNKKVESYDISLYDTELMEDKFPLFGLDLGKPTEKPICLLKGGKGGLGNMHFLTNLIRNPRFAKSGRAGLEQFLMFELKSIADLGLVGLPNAGKSTILNRISNARPRIGHWEFTTLTPTIGTINLGVDGASFTVADIPGIVKDASRDKGLGLEFLRHIERSKGWVFIVDIAKEDPLADLLVLINELGGIERAKTKNVLVVCNKADIDCDKEDPIHKFNNIKAYCAEKNWDIIPISALKGENVDLLVKKMAKCAQAIGHS